MIFSHNIWARHTNPWSGWTRIAVMPILVIGLYLHSWWIISVALLWALVNPVAFPVPKSTKNWMSRGVLGEKAYYRIGPRLKKDIPTLLSILTLFAFLLFLYFGWSREILATILTGLLVVTLKLWFVDRMVVLYGLYKESGLAPAVDGDSTLIEKQTHEKEENKRKILEMFESGKQVANDYIERALGISDSTATRYLDELEKEGRIRQVGDAGRHVYYEKLP